MPEYFLGSKVRPRDSAEDKYHIAKLGPPPAQANLNQAVSIITEKGDPRPPIFDQGAEGCHDNKTEVLTEKGWQAWPDYDGSLLGTINPRSRYLEFQVPIALQRFDYNGPIYHSTNRRVNFALTPEHRMFVRRWNERRRRLSVEYDFIPISGIGWYAGLPHAPEGFLGVEMKNLQVGEREYAGDDFIALLALVVSDGWVSESERHRESVSFCAFSPEKYERAASLAHRLGLQEQASRKGVWTWRDGALAAWLKANAFTRNDYHSPYKRVPDILRSLTERQINLFLDFFGDKHTHTNGHRQFYSSSIRLIDDLQELLLRIGKRSSINTRDPRSTIMKDGRRIEASHCHDEHVLTEWEGSNLSLERKNYIHTDDYSGEVFCATVPNSLLITRREGSVLISGNSCAACAPAQATQAAHNAARIAQGGTADAQGINPGPMYAKARMKEGWFPQDSGSFPADNLDLIRTGVYLLSDEPYVPDPAKDYSEAKLHTEIDYELTHQPFYPGDGKVVENIWNALAAGYPVVQCNYWIQQWFYPKGGKMPAGIDQYLSEGHCTWIHTYIPGWMLCTNQWNKFWSPDAGQFGYNLRPGEFAVPIEYYTKGNTPFTEFRAIVPEAVHVDPTPPSPPIVPIIERVKVKHGGKALVIIGEFSDRARVQIDGVVTPADDEEAGWLHVGGLTLTTGAHQVVVVDAGVSSAPFTSTV